MSDEREISPRLSEQAVVGAVILSGGEALDLLALTPDDFEITAYSLVYAKALELHEAGNPIDQFTLIDSLPRHVSPEIYDAAGSVFTWHNVEFYAALVAEAALRRRIRSAASVIGELAMTTPIAALPDTARSTLDRMIGSSGEVPLQTMGERFDVYLRQMHDHTPAVPTPWEKLNENLGGGLRPGGFYVIGARPGVGKSAIALQLADALAGSAPVLFASLEMPEQEVAMRVISQQVRIPYKALLGDTLAPFMRERLAAWRTANPLNIVIDDTASTSVFDIRNRARTLHRQRPLGGVIVDYLQLMQDPRDLARHEKVSDMTRNLKLLSRELQVPVIACSQLNRESVRRADSRPNLSDLRESGSIEQDADVVILLDREEGSDDLALILAKNRQGQTGTVWTQWQGEFVRAMEVA